MVGDSWTHKIARLCILPLVGTPVTPNHLTTARLATGLAAVAAFAVGDRAFDIWGGWLWLLSAFLDRADGELARVSGKTSPWGHRYDYLSDAWVSGLFFLGAGIGLRESTLGAWTAAAGLAGTFGVIAAEMLAEKIDCMKSDTGEKAFAGFAGFDFDDVLYLFAPVVWLGWQLPFVLGAAVGAPVFALLTWLKLVRLRRDRTATAERGGSA